jgi:hypothetical protein
MRLCGLVSLWESVRRLCALRSDTIVQYAACLTLSSFGERGTASFDSDYSGEAGRSHIFFFCKPIPHLTLSSRILLIKYKKKNPSDKKKPPTIPRDGLRQRSHTAGSGRLVSAIEYMTSVRIVYLRPLSTSSPEWRRLRCWKSSTRPSLGSTLIFDFMSKPWNVVAPPLS